MNTPEPLACDGCGQPASPEHIQKRLQRLEWTTRYRPVHIQTLLLGAVSPKRDEEFLYAGVFEGEAGWVLDAVGLNREGRTSESVLAEFQRAGFLFAHVLECPLTERTDDPETASGLLGKQAPAVFARIRRSLKPKRLMLTSRLLSPLVEKFAAANLGCTLLLDEGQPFSLDVSSDEG
jgi:hypothetical protein